MKRSGKRFRLAALLTAVSLMTGCTASTLETPEEVLPTLAPAAVGWTAPDGDRMEGDEGLWTLYLPGKNGLNLVAQHIPGTPGLLRTERLEQMCRELLSFQANSQVDALRAEGSLASNGYWSPQSLRESGQKTGRRLSHQAPSSQAPQDPRKPGGT